MARPEQKPKEGEQPFNRYRPPPVELPGEEWAVKLASLSAAERTAEVAKIAYRLVEAATKAGDFREARLGLEWLMQLAPKAAPSGKSGGESPL